MCIHNDIIYKKAFDDNNNNDWKESSLRKYLNGEYLQKFTDVNLVSWQQDLIIDDGLDYGSSEDKIFLLTAEQYRKYRKRLCSHCEHGRLAQQQHRVHWSQWRSPRLRSRFFYLSENKVKIAPVQQRREGKE